MRLWLDDQIDDPETPDRHTPPGHVGVKTALHACRILKNYKVTHIDFDHDLGPGLNGYTVACFIEKRAFLRLQSPLTYAMHSANPVGRSGQHRTCHEERGAVLEGKRTMKRTGRPPLGAKNVQRWTGRRWVPDDGQRGQSFIGQACLRDPCPIAHAVTDGCFSMAWSVDAHDDGECPLQSRAMQHCLNTFKNCANGALLQLGDGKLAAVAVLINEDGQVLSIARKDDRTRFGLPGGKREYHETAEDAAIRELWEETGVRTRSDQVRHLYRGVDADGWMVDAYLVYDWQGEPEPREGQEVRWTPWSGLYGPPWGKYNRAVEAALQEDRQRVLLAIVNFVNEAKGCRLVDVAMHVGQDVHPHGRMSELVDELIARDRINAVEYQTPGMRRSVPGLKKYQVIQKFLLPKGSVLL